MLKYINDLSPRQLEAVEKLVKSGSGIAWWKIGEGKTRLALAWASHFGNALVIASPNAFRQWRDEAAKFEWSPSLKFLSYAALHKVNDATLADANCIIIDELWMFKNFRAKRTMLASLLTSHHPTLGLSGSMVTARNLEDIYGQTSTVGISDNIARTLTGFRTQFMVSNSMGHGMEFFAKKGAIEIIQQRIADKVDIYFPKDIRETRIIPTHVDLHKDQQALIYNLSNEYYTQIDAGIRGEQLEISSAAVLVTKIQQISDGAVLDDEGNITFVKSHKLERLLELCAEFADAKERAIIWFAFKASLNKVFKALGPQATALSSDHKFDAKGWANGAYRFCLATVGSGASLDDFANTERAVFYSMPFSPTGFQQAKGRTNRKSTQSNVAYYHVLMTNGTIDQLVYDTVDMSGRIEKTIIRSSAEILKQYMEQYKK